ncbi:MCE family protein [Gordonia sp. TBRC 11910]|uniref:MCE family protein n=1 Tax=Gordonia asplenii TaxID=2725283 RepID=A0A848L3G4_9ACTN|nr:MlaD family protein [Gordonia asplenii]NMO05269.1 MCE family protein [Gordonia asplenii]
MKLDNSPRAIKFGLIGTLVIAAIVLAIFNYRSIPFWPGTTTVTAQFSDVGGLDTKAAVQIAGVKVGDVTSIKLRDDHVDVEMRLSEGWQSLGSESTAAIKVETALGKRYVELTSAGSGQLGDVIPTDRTTAGFDLVDSLNQLTQRVEGTQKAQLSSAVDTLTDAMANLPPDLNVALKGLAGGAQTIASRDAGLRTLLQRAGTVTGVLAARNRNLTSLIDDGAVLFTELNDRAAVIRSLLVKVKLMSDELTALTDDTSGTLPSMLTELHRVTTTLNANYANINKAIAGLRPVITQLGEVVGSGPFFSVLLHNIVPANLHGQQPGSIGGGR